MRNGRFSKWLIFAMTSALLLVSLLFFVSTNAVATRQLGNFPAMVLGRVTGILQLPGDWVSDLSQEVKGLFQTYEENKRLKQRLTALENQDRVIDQLEDENKQLRQSLSVKERFSPQKLLSTRVIYRSTLSWLDVLTVNKGAKDQVTSEMFAMTDKGLVGTIKQLNDNTAQVELLTNTARQKLIGATVETSSGHLYGMVLGYDSDKEALKIGQFHRQQAVAVGDVVVTSGLDGSGLEGVLIGKVKEVGRSEDQALLLYVMPAVDMTELSALTLVGRD